MRSLSLFALFLLASAFMKGQGSYKPIVTRFQTPRKEIALTFDACQSKKPMHFDGDLLRFIEANRLPVTIFLTGNFVRDNAAEVKELSRYPFISFGNHTMHHFQHPEKLSDKAFISEVLTAQKLIKETTGKAPRYFRFPAGNYSERQVQIVDSLGLEVVHWTYASGDADKNIGPDRLVKDAMWRMKPGEILIYHINCRGYGTDSALPEIYGKLTKESYHIVSLTDVLH